MKLGKNRKANKALLDSADKVMKEGNTSELFKSLFNEVINLKQDLLKKFDENGNKKLDKEERNKMLASTEFWGMVLIFLIPIATTIISIVQLGIINGEWNFSILFTVISVIEAPIAIAWLRKRFNIDNRNLESAVISKDNTIHQLVIAVNLIQQFVATNLPKDKQLPPNLLDFIEDTSLILINGLQKIEE